jgi:hypothetical protein
VDGQTAFNIFIATFAYGVIREITAGYLRWRRQRFSRSHRARNAGFLTDGKVLAFEIVSGAVIGGVVLFTLGGVLWLIGLTQGWWTIGLGR